MVKKLLEEEYDTGLLVSGALEVDVNRRDEWNGRTPLMNCGWDPQGTEQDVDSNCVEIGQMLVQRGANASAIDDNNWDAVGLAVVKGLPMYATFLITMCGAPANRLNGVGVNDKKSTDADTVKSMAMTPIHLASSIGSLSVFDAIFKIIITDEGGDDSHYSVRTPLGGLGILHIATRYAATAKTSSSILFLEHVVKEISRVVVTKESKKMDDLAMHRDNDGRTPLMYASLFRCLECARILIEAGFSPYAVDSFGINSFQTHKDIEMPLRNIYMNDIERQHEEFLRSEF
jgi:ankyrin repeat protein